MVVILINETYTTANKIEVLTHYDKDTLCQVVKYRYL